MAIALASLPTDTIRSNWTGPSCSSNGRMAERAYGSFILERGERGNLRRLDSVDPHPNSSREGWRQSPSEQLSRRLASIQLAHTDSPMCMTRSYSLVASRRLVDIVSENTSRAPESRGDIHTSHAVARPGIPHSAARALFLIVSFSIMACIPGKIHRPLRINLCLSGRAGREEIVRSDGMERAPRH